MRSILLCLALGAALAKASNSTVMGDDTCENDAWGQCGGSGYSGSSCCPLGYDCKFDNDYYSGCSLADLCLVVQYGQCGGTTPAGAPWPDDQKCCPGGFVCEYSSPYYSQCSPSGQNTTGCSEPYGQCGGEGWMGPGCCATGYECTPDAVNPIYYSGCTLIPVCTNSFYGQCGGVDSDGLPWTATHDACCPEGFMCSYQSPYYSQCCPEGGCN